MYVVTYAHAYVGGTTTLCGACEDDSAARVALPALGPVAHGAHEGPCDWCARDARGDAPARKGAR